MRQRIIMSGKIDANGKIVQLRINTKPNQRRGMNTRKGRRQIKVKVKIEIKS